MLYDRIDLADKSQVLYAYYLYRNRIYLGFHAGNRLSGNLSKRPFALRSKSLHNP